MSNESIEASRSALQDEVAALKGACVLLPCLQSEVASLQAEVEALKGQNAEMKNKAIADAEAAGSEIIRLRRSISAKVYAASDQLFSGTKAYYARLTSKVRAHLAEKDEVEAALFGVAKYESVLAHLKQKEEAGYELPEGLTDQVHERLSEAKAKADAIEEVEITEEDLAEPSRLDVAFSFRDFNLRGVWIIPDGFEKFGTMRYVIRPVMDEMMAGIKQSLQEDAAETGRVLASMPSRTDDECRTQVAIFGLLLLFL